MNHRYNHLLSPIRIGNVILKNRMIATNSMPHYLMGPEEYPPDSVTAHFVDLSKNGAALLTFPEYLSAKDMPFRSDVPYLDIHPYNNQNYFSQLTDAVHFCGSKISISLVPMLPEGYCVEERPAMNPMERELNPSTAGAPPFSGMGALKEAPTEMIDQTIEDVAQRALIYKQCGFDAVSFHVSYEPMAGAYPYLVKEDEVLCGYQQEEFKDFLKLMNQWYSEGLIWQDFVTDNMAFGITTSSAYDKFLIGDMGCAAGELPDIVDVAAQIGDGAVIAAMPDPSVNGEKNHLTSSGNAFTSKWAISADCEDVELACEFMNYLYTEEGCDLLTYGVEGQSCVKNDDGSFSYTDLILDNPDGISYANAYHLFTFLDEFGLRDDAAMRQFYSEESLVGSDVWSGCRDNAWAYPTGASLTAEENEAFSAAFVTINTYVSECIPKFVLGDMDVDTEFDDFLAEIEAMGIDECTGYKQAAYDRYLARG